MANVPSPDVDDDFSDIYKEYTGPPRSTVTNVAEKGRVNKTLQAGSDEEEEARDPNAVPTDFTSREAKVWEAKSKATERNWKKRKEEEMICKICGESGHFTQGCPSTLGANRKSQDFLERVPARDKHVKALFSEKVIHKIESDIGCKLKMEEKFLIVSAKNSSIMEKGVDAVRKVIKEGEKGDRGGSSSQRSRSRSPDRARVGAHLGRSDSQRSHSSPWNSSQFHQRINRQEKVNEDHFREDLQQLSRASQAYGNDGARSRSSHSKSPARPTFSRNAFNSYEDHSRSVGSHKIDELDVNKRGSDMSSGHKYEYSTYPQTLEELELQYKREAMELGKIRDKEEDEENYKHRETVSVMREDYIKKLAIQRGMQSKHWEEFLQLDHQRRQQAREHLPSAGFTATGYNNPGYNDFDRTSSNPHYGGAGAPVDSRGRYLYPAENISTARSHENYGEFQRQRHEGYGKAYNRY